ncbi:MAG: electron transport complex subunit RsxC [Oscillospiraceae bacterium]
MPLFKLKGAHVPHRKNTAQMAAVRMPAPKSVTIPVSMHIGAPAVPTVKVGDHVCIGDVIASAGGFVSAPIHASISGTVKKVDTILSSSGSNMNAITIESDGEMKVSENVKPPVINSYEDFVNAVRESGIVGLGGAGFPTAVKLSIKDLSKVQAVVINGAECEPYITSDTRTMLDDADWMRKGFALLEKYLGVKNIVVGIEKNKPECIAKMNEIAASDPCVTVKPLPSVYPQGGEKVLIYHTIGAVVPEGKLPLDAGAVVMNCTTLAFIAKYAETGMPLVEKCVTVDGGAVKEPKNVIVPIGTALQEVFDFCGGFKEEPGKVLYGGPMMGIAVPDTSVPILKNTNAIIAMTAKEAEPKKTTPCIRCGSCVDHCPLHLNPVAISKAFKDGDCAELAALKVNLCMECGCCSFVCPTGQPLVQRNKLSKAMLRNNKPQEAKK